MANLKVQITARKASGEIVRDATFTATTRSAVEIVQSFMGRLGGTIIITNTDNKNFSSMIVNPNTSKDDLFTKFIKSKSLQ